MREYHHRHSAKHDRVARVQVVQNACPEHGRGVPIVQDVSQRQLTTEIAARLSRKESNSNFEVQISKFFSRASSVRYPHYFTPQRHRERGVFFLIRIWLVASISSSVSTRQPACLRMTAEACGLVLCLSLLPRALLPGTGKRCAKRAIADSASGRCSGVCASQSSSCIPQSTTSTHSFKRRRSIRCRTSRLKSTCSASHGNTATLQQIHKQQRLPTDQVPHLLIRQGSPVKKLDEQERRWL